MTVLGFTVTFHGPFRVGAAYARDGIDAALDQHDPLPPDHLKGVMRAAAAGLFGQEELGRDGEGRPRYRDHEVVREVFGSHRTPCPWSWSAARPDRGGWNIDRRHRVAIHPGKHSALKDHLVLGEQAWPASARFEISRTGILDELAEADHVLVLRCAAAAVHGLGAWRRRGLGWIGITPDEEAIDAGDVRRLLSLRGGAR